MLQSSVLKAGKKGVEFSGKGCVCAWRAVSLTLVVSNSLDSLPHSPGVRVDVEVGCNLCAVGAFSSSDASLQVVSGNFEFFTVARFKSCISSFQQTSDVTVHPWLLVWKCANLLCFSHIIHTLLDEPSDR